MYSVSGVKIFGSSTAQAEGGTFTYYNDGLLKFATDARTDAAYGLHDRAYSYDHSARLKSAYSGYEARDYVNGTSSGYHDGAFQHTYGYDAFDNQTSRSGRYWSDDDTGTDSYNSQNRNTAWSYDADGRITSTNDPAPDALTWSPLTLSYNAAGQQGYSTQTTSRADPIPGHDGKTLTTVYNRTKAFDGNGALSKLYEWSQINTATPVTSTTHYLRSSLNGKVIAEYDGSGTKRKANVYAGGDVIAQQLNASTSSAFVYFEHTNPVNGDSLNTDTSGHAHERTTVDPSGVNTGDTDPYSSPSPGLGEVPGGDMGQSAMNSVYGSYFGGYGQPYCNINGVLQGCHVAGIMMMSGSAAFEIHGRSGRTFELPIENEGLGLYSYSIEAGITTRHWRLRFEGSVMT